MGWGDQEQVRLSNGPKPTELAPAAVHYEKRKQFWGCNLLSFPMHCRKWVREIMKTELDATPLMEETLMRQSFMFIWIFIWIFSDLT